MSTVINCFRSINTRNSKMVMYEKNNKKLK